MSCGPHPPPLCKIAATSDGYAGTSRFRLPARRHRGERPRAGHARAALSSRRSFCTLSATGGPPSRAADGRGSKRQRPQDEQVVVLRPPHPRQQRHGDEDDGQAPVIAGSHPRMATPALRAQHRNQAGADSSEPRQHMHCEDPQEDGESDGIGMPATVIGFWGHVHGAERYQAMRQRPPTPRLSAVRANSVASSLGA